MKSAFILGFFGVIYFIFITTYFSSKVGSIHSRMYIYENITKLSDKKLNILLGHGPGSFTKTYFDYLIEKNYFIDDINTILISKAYLNSGMCEYLTLYVEYGLIGLILILFLIFLKLKKYFYSLLINKEFIEINKLGCCCFY
ncbi:MAG: hypothetical protein IPJ13_07000 [Saprospiraceae bacterium]|nr:hypothetical protein [Saprospiraceae bacterium]